MGLQIGDVVFDAKGHPGVVVDKNPSDQSLTVERQGEQFEETRQRGFINGMSQETRAEVKSILESVADSEDVKEQVQQLSEHIRDLQQDPRNFRVVRYLEAQLGHIMNTYRINPRVYVIDQDSVR